ncbi:MAG: carbon-nitrogen hydrolase family protein [Oligoflexales bacterium]
MVMSSVKIASICMCSKANVHENIEKAINLVKSAAENGANWVLLPEMFTYMGGYSGLYNSAEIEKGPLNKELASIAKKLGITLIAGTVGEKPLDNELHQDLLVNKDKGYRRVFNTLYGFSDSGEQFVKYRKTHLFELAAFEKGSTYSEADGFLAGNQFAFCEYQGWNIGFAICYDLRFSSLFFQITKEKPLDLLIVPAAFTEATGKRHWQLLLQARAVENQCYVLAANQTGEHRDGKRSFGHSMIIDPWGKVLENTGEKEGFVLAEIDKVKLEQFRKTLPVRENQRLDLYK